MYARKDVQELPGCNNKKQQQQKETIKMTVSGKSIIYNINICWNGTNN